MFEWIQEMRLRHAAGCTQPEMPEEKIRSNWTLSKIAKRVAIPALTDPFDIYLSGEIVTKHQPG